MNAIDYFNVGCALVGLLAVIVPFLYRILRNELMLEIDKKGKDNINYMGKACQDLIKTHEMQNEKIREERQIRYSQNITQIHDLVSNIHDVLEKIQKDINENGRTITKHEFQIEKINKELESRA